MNNIQIWLSWLLEHHESAFDQNFQDRDRWRWWQSFAWVPVKSQKRWVWFKPMWFKPIYIGERLERQPDTEHIHRPGLPIMVFRIHSEDEHLHYKLTNA